MLFLPRQCNLSRLGKLSPVKWIARNCGWPITKQNRLNQLIRDRLVKWRVAISLSLSRELKVAISLSLNLPVFPVQCFFFLPTLMPHSSGCISDVLLWKGLKCLTKCRRIYLNTQVLREYWENSCYTISIQCIISLSCYVYTRLNSILDLSEN